MGSYVITFMTFKKWAWQWNLYFQLEEVRFTVLARDIKWSRRQIYIHQIQLMDWLLKSRLLKACNIPDIAVYSLVTECQQWLTMSRTYFFNRCFLYVARNQVCYMFVSKNELRYFKHTMYGYVLDLMMLSMFCTGANVKHNFIFTNISATQRQVLI